MTVKNNNLINFTKKYIWYFASLSFFLIIILGTVIVSTTNTRVSHINCQITENIKEYDEIDLEHICNIAGCTKIYTKDKEFVSKNGFLEEVPFKMPKMFKISDKLYMDKTNVILYNKKANIYLEKNFYDYAKDITEDLFFVFILFVIIFSIFLYRTYKRERNEAMITNIGNEAILANKSMVMITENVHHEMNTPVDVIENKIEKVHRVINGYIESQKQWQKDNEVDLRNTPENRKWNKKMKGLEKDFEYIHLSIEQIMSVLGKMKNFKSLRYSNGDKSIYNVISGAFRIILISYSNIECHIDEDFKNYRMGVNGLKNIDLLNILINHIKNSIEADATKIEIYMEEPPKNNIMKLIIKDNGNGIPDNIRKNVFEPNFSSKQIGDSIRGNGMYLNKHIVKEFGGDIKILESSNEGTIIEISFSSRTKENPEYEVICPIKNCTS